MDGGLLHRAPGPNSASRQAVPAHIEGQTCANFLCDAHLQRVVLCYNRLRNLSTMLPLSSCHLLWATSDAGPLPVQPLSAACPALMGRQPRSARQATPRPRWFLQIFVSKTGYVTGFSSTIEVTEINCMCRKGQAGVFEETECASLGASSAQRNMTSPALE